MVVISFRFVNFYLIALFILQIATHFLLDLGISYSFHTFHGLSFVSHYIHLFVQTLQKTLWGLLSSLFFFSIALFWPKLCPVFCFDFYYICMCGYWRIHGSTNRVSLLAQLISNKQIFL
ncbi:hypothetical protein FRX31_005173 [Thalictrum thalictroides]|uniref:Uncharacterized protein n=1 Tax=Thalictrum thalictroides TaxID=46969 RepID=A0A7J6X9R9_THATH|nr:hypothetical protein FRX31_005173 [Thalictrum thalictroides]